MLPDKPSVPTNVTPYEIVGGMMDVFLNHFEICGSGTGDFPDKMLDQKIGAAARLTIAEIYKDLRKHGFYPAYVVSRRMVWRTTLKCKVLDKIDQSLIDNPPARILYVGMPSKERSEIIGEYKEQARSLFKGIGLATG